MVRGALRLDEFARIRHWTAGRQSPEWLSERGVVVGIGDDAAVVEQPQGTGPLQWVLAVDTMVETVHFNAVTMEDADIGYKALAANISDLAAMGAVPRHALVSVSVPPSFGPERMRRLYDGLYACAERYGVAVVGGDTTSSPAGLVVAVTAVGTVEAGKALRRSGAQPGDAVFMTGPAGLAAAGLHWLAAAGASGATATAAEAAGTAALVRAHRRPAPSVKAGLLLAARGTCRSLNDVSDGLASEAWEIAEASGVTMVLREELLPLSGSLAAYASAAGIAPLEWMLYGGEDYVLLGTIDADDAEAVKTAFLAEGLPFYRIGEVEVGVTPGVCLERADTERGGPHYASRRVKVEKRGYNHFNDKFGV
jgi:thiamine-monophosphate kinase